MLVAVIDAPALAVARVSRALLAASDC